MLAYYQLHWIEGPNDPSTNIAWVLKIVMYDLKQICTLVRGNSGVCIWSTNIQIVLGDSFQDETFDWSKISVWIKWRLQKRRNMRRMLQTKTWPKRFWIQKFWVITITPPPQGREELQMAFYNDTAHHPHPPTQNKLRYSLVHEYRRLASNRS